MKNELLFLVWKRYTNFVCSIKLLNIYKQSMKNDYFIKLQFEAILQIFCIFSVLIFKCDTNFC